MTHPLRQDDLKKMSGICDGIIFDAMEYSKWSAEDAICLLDWDEQQLLDADIPLIFTTNKKPKKSSRGSYKQRDAIKRRYRAIEITGPLQLLARPLCR